MKIAGVSGPKLAAAIGVKAQSFTNLRRKANGGMRAELLARAADVLRCDLRWLCTGEGGDYVGAKEGYTRMASEVAAWIDAMNENDRLKAYAICVQMNRGYWPTFTSGEPAPTDR